MGGASITGHGPPVLRAPVLTLRDCRPQAVASRSPTRPHSRSFTRGGGAQGVAAPGSELAPVAGQHTGSPSFSIQVFSQEGSDRAHLSGSWWDQRRDVHRAPDTGRQVAGGPSPSLPDTT